MVDLIALKINKSSLDRPPAFRQMQERQQQPRQAVAVIAYAIVDISKISFEDKESGASSLRALSLTEKSNDAFV
jgi:hypothetical protein